jgi:hypothetical protein
MMKRIGLVCFLLLVASPLFAVCTIDIPGQSSTAAHTLTWVAVPGANQYFAEYSNDAFVTTTRVPLGSSATFFDLQRTVTFPIDYSFRVTAVNDQNPDFLCTGTARRLFTFNFPFRVAVERTVIPIVATIPGANGSQFKTSLRLTAPTALAGKGKIIFHPAGTQGNDSDPSIPYSFSRDGQTIVFDDIVGAFGATGVGSIDIVPAGATFGDPSNSSAGVYVPIAEAHLYNQTAGGTFGSFEHHVQPIDFLNSNEVRAHASETAQYRVNVGVRTISTSTINFDIYDTNNDVRVHRSFTYPPNFVLLSSPEALLGTALAPGETLAIAPERGSIAIPFYTYTDNGTNDPTIFMPEFSVKVNLGPYDVAGALTIQ